MATYDAKGLTVRKFLTTFAVACFPAAIAALLGTGTAVAQRVEAGQAPPAWIAYAQAVSTTVQARLESDDPQALRLRAYLQQLPGAAEPDDAVLKVAFWIDRSGRITRIEHALFAQGQPNDDLQALVVGQALPQAPPRGMLLPLRLSIRIKPRPAETAPQRTPTSMTVSLHHRLPATSSGWS